MRIPSLIALLLAGSLALATPAAAQDDRFPAPGKDLFKLICQLFGGIYHEFKDVGAYVCQFSTGDVVCDGTECWVVVHLESAPLKEECDVAGGKYWERSDAIFSCELEEGVMMLECVAKEEWHCRMGWMAAKDPEKLTVP